MTRSFDDGVLRFAPDLGDNLARGDANYLSVLDEADAYIARNGLDLPAEPEARIIGPDPGWVADPVLELDLHEHGVTSIVWATGYRVDYGWLKVDAFDEAGRPVHHRGISCVPGIYFLGLPWQTRRGSSFIFGVWQDAKLLADHIASPAQLPRPGRRRQAVARKYRSDRHDHTSAHPPVQTPATPTRTKSWTTTCAMRWSPTAPCTCAARSAPTSKATSSASEIPRAQTDQAMANVEQLLREAGSDLSHIVKTTIYITDPRYRQPVYQTVGRWLRGVHPVSTGLVVSGLAQPEWLMEIDVIAVMPQ